MIDKSPTETADSPGRPAVHEEYTSEKGANSDPSETCYIEQRVLAGMSQPSWEDIVELPDELDDETAEELRANAAEVQETDHVPSTENVPKAVGDGFYRIFLRRV